MQRLRTSASAMLALGLASALSAQLQPGQSIAAVTVSVTGVPSIGEMYAIDWQAKTSTMLTLSTALTTERPNCVTMLNGVIGFLGTNPVVPTGLPPIPGDIYRFTIAGNVVTETKLNTTPTAGPNVAQLALVGGSIYFVTQNATNVGGILQSIPQAGGPVTTHVDLTTVPGVTGLANCCTAIGTKVYVAMFDSGSVATNSGAVVEFDTVTNTPRVFMQLPQGKYQTGPTTFFNTGIVHALPDATNPNQIVLLGVYGDLLYVDVTTGTVTRHDFTGPAGATAGTTATNLTNSFAYRPEGRDFVVGSRDGFAEAIADGRSAEKIVGGVGSSATPSQNSIGGIAHVPATQGLDETIGAGCPGTGGFALTTFDTGLPAAGNAAFRAATYSGTGGDLCALILGTTNTPIDLTILGMTGCTLRTNLVVTIGATLSGTGNGVGTASILLPIPATGAGAVLYTQWAEVQATPTNTLGIVLSNARRMTVQ